MEKLFSNGIRIIIIALLILSVKSSYSQSCDKMIVGAVAPPNNVIDAGEVGCVTADFSGSVTVRSGGELRICGSYTFSGSITVDDGANVVLTAGTSVGFTGSMTFNGPNSLSYSGDPTCEAELFEVAPGNGFVTWGAGYGAGGNLTSSSNVYLDGFTFAWGPSTIGSGNHGRATPPLCASIEACDATLPVELINFRADYHSGEVNLKWSTVTELDNDFFTVERSIDGIDWETHIHIPGAGNSSELRNYSATDFLPYDEGTFYRLKQTDYNGTVSYSKVIHSVSKENRNEIEVYPNPTAGMLTIDPKGSEVLKSFQLLSLEGEEVMKGEFNIELDFVLDLRNHAKGVYLLRVMAADNVYFEKITLQ